MKNGWLMTYPARVSLSGMVESLSCFLTTFMTAMKLKSAYWRSSSKSMANFLNSASSWRMSSGTCSATSRISRDAAGVARSTSAERLPAIMAGRMERIGATLREVASWRTAAVSRPRAGAHAPAGHARAVEA